MDDTISRGAALDARRYTFGNDEFSLEAAYHDCKLVFDGITDDDSFQEADTGLLLYYANEIIYALQEALDKDANVPSTDTISRQQAIATAVSAAIDWHRLANPQYSIAYSIGEAMRALPSAQQWIPWDSGKFPGESGYYTVTAFDGATKRVTYAKYQKRLKRWELTGARAYWRVLAWLPLPEPWKGGREFNE